MNGSVLFAVIFVWVAVVIYFLMKALLNCCRSEVVTNVLQKGFNPKDKTKEIFKYICEPIFSDPTTDFDTTKSCLTLELIYVNEKSVKTKLTAIKMDFRDATISRTVDCQTYIRGFFLIHRHRALPPVTHIRAVHNSTKGKNLFIDYFFSNLFKTFFQ